MTMTLFGVEMTLFCAVLLSQTPPSSQPARRGPEFLDRATIYQVWPRSFSREGKLTAVTAKLPYIADLGASIVYLTPIQRMSTDPRPEFWSNRMRWSTSGEVRNPYRISDYDTIDPEFGTEQELRELVAAAHRLGLKVMMDIVFFHTGPDSVLLARPGFVKRTADGRPETGSWRFPILNFESRELRQYLIGNLVHWVRDVGIDGFRCDVAGRVPLDFWAEARAELDKVNREAILLSEAEVPEQQLEVFDASYSFQHYRSGLVPAIQGGESATLIRGAWEKLRAAFPRGARFMHFSDHHGRDPADVVFGAGGAEATAVLNFTLDGIPCVYNGQEFGDTTLNDIMAHYPIRWDLATVDRQEVNMPNGAPRLALYKRLFALRAQEAALTSGEVVWVNNSAPDDVVSFLRRQGGEEILVVVNIRNRKDNVSVAVPAGRVYRPLLAPPKTPSSLAGDAVALGPFGYFVGKTAAR